MWVEALPGVGIATCAAGVPGRAAARRLYVRGWRGQLDRNISFVYTAMMWEVRLHPEVESWFLELCQADPAARLWTA